MAIPHRRPAPTLTRSRFAPHRRRRRNNARGQRNPSSLTAAGQATSLQFCRRADLQPTRRPRPRPSTPRARTSNAALAAAPIACRGGDVLAYGLFSHRTRGITSDEAVTARPVGRSAWFHGQPQVSREKPPTALGEPSRRPLSTNVHCRYYYCGRAFCAPLLPWNTGPRDQPFPSAGAVEVLADQKSVRQRHDAFVVSVPTNCLPMLSTVLICAINRRFPARVLAIRRPRGASSRGTNQKYHHPQDDPSKSLSSACAPVTRALHRAHAAIPRPRRRLSFLAASLRSCTHDDRQPLLFFRDLVEAD